MHIVTAGSAYVDIDAYAGCVAYAELLQAQGKEAQAISTAPLNESISQTVRSWNAPLQTAYEPSEKDTYILVDLSDPIYFDKIVDLERVEEVIDHHVGFEKYWQQKLDNNARIEFIGAACTLVYERWEAVGLVDKMSELSARLLVCGILDNTLNFGAKVTTTRDTKAYDVLLAKANLPADWTAQYFKECQAAIVSDIPIAVQNDKKIATFKTFDQPVCCGQMAVWDAKQVLAGQQEMLQQTLAGIRPSWFLNLICISERKSYIVAADKNVQLWLSGLLNVRFEGSVAVADRLWLRKEIIKQDLAGTSDSLINSV